LRFSLKTKKLADLYYDDKGAKSYPAPVVRSFFEVMAIIESAPDERDFYGLKSLHYEKLEGRRGVRGERSMRLNREYRLIVAVERDDQGRLMLIISINKHYGD